MEASAAPTPSRPRILPPGLLRLASDERLVALVRDGHERAFEALYDRHHAQILSFCRHMLGTREEAEDAVQQTFLSAYRDLAVSDKALAVRAWLFTIARNRCLSVLRARRDHANLDDVEPATDGLVAEVHRREELRHLLRDLARLPDEQRAALVLAELGSLGHDEIAQVLDCPKERVKALVFQARSSLAASRDARETPCEQIREQLATLRGGALRRTQLRRHLRDCPGCRAFQGEVQRQRAAFAIVLPVLPSVALKHGVFAGAGAAGAGVGGAVATGGGASGVAGGLAALGAKGLAVKALIAGAVIAGGAAGGVEVVNSVGGPAKTPPPPGVPVGIQGGGALATPPATPPRSAQSQGFLPETKPGPLGNGPAAQTFAGSRGAGRKLGLSPAEPGRADAVKGKPAASPKHVARRVRRNRPVVPAYDSAPTTTEVAPTTTDKSLPSLPIPRGKGLLKQL